MKLRQLAGLELRTGHVSLSAEDYELRLALRMGQLKEILRPLWSSANTGGLLYLSDQLEKPISLSSERVLPLLAVIYRKKRDFEDVWARVCAFDLEDE